MEKCTRHNVGGKRFLKKNSFALAGSRREGHRRWRSVLAERRRKAFFKKEFFCLGGRPPWRIPTISKCTFLLCGRKVPKRTHPSGGEPTDSPPLGIPPLPWGCFMGTESPSLAHGTGAARSKSLYRAFAEVRLCPRFYSFGGLAKPIFHWQSTRAARRIAEVAESARFAAHFKVNRFRLFCALP